MGSSVAVRIVGVAAAVGLLYFFRSILAPVCTAVVITIVIHWVGDSLARMMPRAGRWAAMAVTSLLATATILAGSAIISGGVARLVPQADRIAGRLQEMLEAIIAFVGPLGTLARLDIRSLIDQANLASLAQAGLQQMASSLSALALTLLLVAFLLPSRPRWNDKLAALTRSPTSMDARLILGRVVQGVRQTILVQLLAAGITAFASALVMWLVGMPDVTFWTVVVFLIAFVPVVGGSIAAVLVAAFALVQLPTYEPVAVIFAAIQAAYLIAGSIFVPRMQSMGSNLDPVVGLVFVGVWTLLWGIPGALLANSLTVLMMIVFAEFESTRWVAVLLSNDGKPGSSKAADR